MRYLKMLALAASAVGILVALVGADTSSARVLCTTDKDPCPTAWVVKKKWRWSKQKSKSAKMETTSGTVLDTCTGGEGSTGEISDGGEVESIPITSEITELTWSGCTNTTDTLKTGSIEITEASGNQGTVTFKSTEVTVNSIFGSCIYGAGAATDIGTLFSVISPEEEAAVEVNAVFNKTGGSATCPADIRFVDRWVITGHKVLYVVKKSD